MTRVFDETIELKENAMLKHKPELWNEWNFEKNDELGLDIYSMTYGTDKKAWWTCPKCKSNYNSHIGWRVKGGSCPYCRGLKVNHTNSLASLNPQLASEWHPTLNGDITPHKVTCGNNKKAWWVGKCGHEWEATINSRSQGNGCPYCANQKILIGFNDMWTTNPELASWLANPEDGYKYTQFSNLKLDWKCPNCKNIVKRTVGNIGYRRHVPCSICSDGISYPEKFVQNILLESKINFKKEKTFEWGGKVKYDFYLPEINTIVEVHGEQHYNGGFSSCGGRNLEEEQENDRHKHELAMRNGIENYIIINAKESNMEWIKNSLVNSGLKNIIDFNKINWNSIEEKSVASLVVQCWDMYNNGIARKEICKNLNLTNSTIGEYLKKGRKIGKIIK